MRLEIGGFQLVGHVCTSSPRPNPWCRETTSADKTKMVNGASVLTFPSPMFTGKLSTPSKENSKQAQQ